MRAHLLLNEKLEDIPTRIIKNTELNSIIILTDKHLYSEFTKKHPQFKVVLIDLFNDEDSVIKSEATEEIMQELLDSSPGLYWEEYKLTEILVNQLFGYMERVYNLINGLEKVINEYSIQHLSLYGGNPKVQFIPLTLSEGERAFKFIYKRSWSLNYFVNEGIKDKVIIEWRSKTPAIFLKIISIVRPKVILLGKLISIIKRSFKRSRKLEFIIRDSNKDKPIALFMVRNPIQVEPLIPIYNEFNKEDEFIPLFLAFENYSNNNLNNELKRRKLNYIDLYDMLTVKKIFKSLKEITTIKKRHRKGTIINKIIGRYQFGFSSDEIIRNLFPFIMDILVVIKLLNKFSKDKNSICCLINNETHGYHTAIQSEWIRKKCCPSIGIQHVSIANKLKPKISRVDTMFMMTKDITIKLSEIKPDEKFVFLGPVAYDLNFNTTTHTNQLNRISIFTQPDDFKKEYLDIVEDTIDILSLNHIDVKLNIKLHPRERDFISFQKYEKNNPNVKVIGSEITSNELIKNSDLVLSIHSGVIMQSIIIGTPTISVNYGNRHDIKLDFINHDVTKKVTLKEELEVCLLNIKSLSGDYYSNRDLFLESHLDGYDGNAATKVYDFIKMNIENYQSMGKGSFNNE